MDGGSFWVRRGDETVCGRGAELRLCGAASPAGGRRTRICSAHKKNLGQAVDLCAGRPYSIKRELTAELSERRGGDRIKGPAPCACGGPDCEGDRRGEAADEGNWREGERA